MTMMTMLMMLTLLTMMNSNNHDHFTDFLTAFLIFLPCAVFIHLQIFSMSSLSCGRQTKLAAHQLFIVR